MALNEELLTLLEVINAEVELYGNARNAYIKMKDELESAIRSSSNKKAGQNALAKFCESIIKKAPWSYAGAWIEDNMQAVCDGHVIVFNKKPIDLPTLDNPNPPKVSKIASDVEAAGWDEIIDIDAKEFIGRAKVVKATAKSVCCKHIVYTTAHGYGIDLNYILPMVKILGDCKLYLPKDRRGLAKLTSDDGDAILYVLPVKLGVNCSREYDGEFAYFK